MTVLLTGNIVSVLIKVMDSSILGQIQNGRNEFTDPSFLYAELAYLSLQTDSVTHKSHSAPPAVVR